MKTVRIIGIDPGYDRLGWAIAEARGNQYKILACDAIVTDRSAELVDRFQQLYTDLCGVLDQYQPEEAAIESLYFSKNKTTAMKVAEARGVIISALFTHDLPIDNYNPMQIKQAVTGNGRANKRAVEKMVRLQTNVDTNSKLDDTLDAVAVCITHAVQRRSKRYNDRQ